MTKFAGAVLAVAVGVLLGVWLVPLVDASVVMLLTVMIAAWFWGLWPAILASVVATWALDYFFTPPLYTLSFDLTHLPHSLIFVGIAVCSATASASRRNALRSVEQARDQLDAKVRERTADLTRLAGHLIHAQEEERSRIGRELHDHISQMLGVLTIRIDQLRAARDLPGAIAADLEELRESTAEVTAEIHSLSHRLHSSTLDYLGLIPALHKLVTDFSARHDIDVRFMHDSVPLPLSSDVALCLFRVAEESLTNIAKHSRAASAHVQLSGRPDGLHLLIEDGGIGFDLESIGHREGLGFVSMRERLRLLQGAVRVDSAAMRGTTIEAWIPAASLSARTAPEFEPVHVVQQARRA